MVIARQMEVRSNIKKYFDLAYSGEPVIIPRKQDRNVVIISEAEYKRMQMFSRLSAYADGVTNIREDNSTQTSSSSGQVRSHNLDKLSIIRSLKTGWNGNGAPSFPASLIDRVEGIINELNIQPEIFPTALSTIQLEYDNSRRDHMEIEIGENEMAEIFIVYFNGMEETGVLPATAEAINERVNDFYG